MKDTETIDKIKLIEKVYHLETQLGDKFTYMTLAPFQFDGGNVIEVQRAAKKIADFVGLKNQTFVISYSTQRRNVGGHIDINQGNDVFIEIDEQFKSNHSMVSAILAHEICHKYLYAKNLDFKDEILTDITTVYLGLGKISLNGCEYSTSHSTYTGNKTTTTTKTQRVGYLDRNQFAFLYRIVSEMKKVEKETMYLGLTVQVSNVLKNIEQNEAAFFSGNNFDKDTAINRLTDFNDRIDEFQKIFARLNKHIKVIQSQAGDISSDVNSKYNSFHSYRKSILEKLAPPFNDSTATDSWQYIRNLWLRLEVEEIHKVLSAKEQDVKDIQNCIADIVKTLKTAYPHYFTIQNSQYLLTFSCPICNHAIKFPRNILARVKCPNTNCQYYFMVDTDNQLLLPDKNTPLHEVYFRDAPLVYKIREKISKSIKYFTALFN